MSADNQVVWVTARGSDALLGFSATKLRTDPRHALVAKVLVGEVPLGEALVDHGTKIVIADSNLKKLAGVPSNVAVVSTADALNGKRCAAGIRANRLGATGVRRHTRRLDRAGDRARRASACSHQCWRLAMTMPAGPARCHRRCRSIGLMRHPR